MSDTPKRPPSRALITSSGSAGDIHPFIAIGRALQARGCEVIFAANPYFRERIEESGLGFYGIGERLAPEDVVRENPATFHRWSGTRLLIRDHYGPHMRETIFGIRDAAREVRPDVMIGHQISFGGPWVAHQAGVPWFTGLLTPSFMISDADPSVYLLDFDFNRAPMWVRRGRHWLLRTAINALLEPVLKPIRREMGMPARGDTVFGEMLEGRVLAMFSSAFRGPAPGDPPGMNICGFPWFDRAASGVGLPPALEAFLRAGEPPIVVALGSVLSQTAEAVQQRAVRAALATGRRVVLIGRDGLDDRTRDPHVIRAEYAPFGLLFPRAAAVVHHGGIGSTAQALRCGVPSLVVAFAHDQFDNASRIERLGVGVRSSRLMQEPAMVERLGRLIRDDQMRHRAEELGRVIDAEDGGARAAELILGAP